MRYVTVLMKPVSILEVCQVTPAPASPGSSTESESLSLPLTCFDVKWLKFHPVERLFFFSLTHSDPTSFNSLILHKLKLSLSLALSHFLPLAGKLIWPADCDVPFVRFSVGDGVSLTVAESNADFSIMSGFQPRKADDSHYYVPELHVSDSETSVIALQITLFPNQGFCIGISSHHALLDGKSSVMFMTAWAHICKHLEEGTHQDLPPELTPFFDRTSIGDADGLTMKFLDFWVDFTSRSLKLMRASQSRPDLMRATFRLSQEDIKKLREKVLSELKNHSDDVQHLHLSTFVLTYAYTTVSYLKAKGAANNALVYFLFVGDCRSRLVKPLPPNFFGNCLNGVRDIGGLAAEIVADEKGIANVAKKLSNCVKKIQNEKAEALLQLSLETNKLFFQKEPKQAAEYLISIAGSPRFEVYGTDFGWGRPTTVEISSVDRNSAFSLAESGDGSGGVEVGVVLKEPEMKIFQSLFTNGLNSL